MSDYELTEEQRMIRTSVRAIAEKYFKPKAAEVDKTRRPLVENIKILAEHGFAGTFIPEEYGGAGLKVLDNVLLVEEISRCCASTAILVGCTDGATPRTILPLGTEAQKRKYLPRVVKGELLCGWSLLNPTPARTSAISSAGR